MLYYFIGAVVLMLIGIVGIIIPAVPGIPLMALIVALYQIFTRGLSTTTLIILGLITLISILIDYSSGVLGAKFSGANGKSTMLGIIGMFLAIGLFPPFGAIIGLFAGILAGELFFQKDAKKAIKAASGGAISAILGIAINLLLGLSFIAIFIINALKTL
jgi:hypothetical protein